MHDYEFTIIVQPDLDEEARNQLLERVGGWLKESSTEDTEPTINHWGKRQLAYPINKYKTGYYVFYEIPMDPTKLDALERNLRFNEDVLRYLIIRKD